MAPSLHGPAKLSPLPKAELLELKQSVAELGEWRDPHGSSIPIEFEDVFLALGRTPDEVSLSATHLREMLCIDRHFG